MQASIKAENRSILEESIVTPDHLRERNPLGNNAVLLLLAVIHLLLLLLLSPRMKNLATRPTDSEMMRWKRVFLVEQVFMT